MRVLMLASYFPKPDNRIMGNWALSQAQAFLRAGLEVSVVSGTSWIPRALAFSPGARAYAACPASHQWGELPVSYPRWLLYPVKPLQSMLAANPRPLIETAWWSVRGHLRKAVRNFRPDLVYAHHTQVNGYLAWRIHQMTGTPYVITDHDFGEIEACRTHAARRRFFEPIVSASSRMVAVAGRMEGLVRDLFPRARAVTIHNGTDRPHPDILRQPRPSELASGQVVFAACAFYERKGVPLLVRAFARTAGRFPQAVLRIAGDGETRPLVEQAIRETGMQARVRLLGRIPHERVLQEMAWADVFALPGWDEPFATAFSEALSVGCPIIYARDGGIADVVRDGVHGIAVEPKSEESAASALQTLLANEPERRSMGVAARALFEKQLLWDHHAIQMKSVFAQAVSASADAH